MTSAPIILSGALWSALDVGFGCGLRFVTTVVLAHYLSPEEFGTVAVLALFVGVASAFVDSGLGAALIQCENATQEDASTVFWFNVAAACTMALALIAISPMISAVFDKPVLTSLTRVLAATIVIGSFGAVHRALLRRRLKFRPLMVVGAASTIVSGASAIALAIGGFGVWALAGQTVVAGVVEALMLWILSPWRPKFVFSFNSARRLSGFGGFMLASALLEIGYTRFYTLLIGRFYGVAELGQFARADGLASLPGILLTSTVARVAFPALSTMSSDRERMAVAMRFGLQAIMLVNAPAMLGLAVVAEPLILTLYGPQWRAAVPLAQVLCLGGLLMPLHVLNLQVLMAFGRSDLFFRFEVFKKVVGIGILVVASLLGPIGVAWGVAVSGFVAFLINASQAKRLMGYGAWSQLEDVAMTLVLAAAMAGLVEFVDVSSHTTPAVRLATGVAVGLVFQGGVIMVVRPYVLRAFCACWLRRGEAEHV